MSDRMGTYCGVATRLRRYAGKCGFESRPILPLALLIIVVGMFQYDYVDVQNRICVYQSVRGTHVMTISAMSMCPLTAEFEVK